MKKIILTIIAAIIIFPSATFAADEKLSIDCETSKKKNQEIACEITGYAPYEVSAIEYIFAFEGDFEYKEFQKASVWEGEEENQRVLLYAEKNLTNEFPIGKLIFKAKKKDIKPEITDVLIDFYNGDYIKQRILDRTKEFNQENVKKEEKENNNSRTSSNNILIYVIILLIIVVVSGITTFILVKKNRSEKHEENNK